MKVDKNKSKVYPSLLKPISFAPLSNALTVSISIYVPSYFPIFNKRNKPYISERNIANAVLTEKCLKQKKCLKSLTIMLLFKRGINDMLSLLKIKASGYKMLADNFEIDFLTKARVCENEDDASEIINITDDLYTFNAIALTGSNSSGKSTTLNLISNVIYFMKTGRWRYRPIEFKNDFIKLHLEFFIDGVIYLYDSEIHPSLGGELGIISPYCSIKNEILKFAEYKPGVGRKYAELLDYNKDTSATGIEDTSVLLFLCKDHIIGNYLSPFSINGVTVTNSFFECLNYFNNELTTEIIKLLDDSIEKIKYLGGDSVEFVRRGQKKLVLNRTQLLNQLSNGTIKGIELYIRVVSLLKNGGILIVDEIENCFHKNLVNNLLFLLMDKTINKHNAQIIFSTHYVEILDVFQRRDNIFILHKTDGNIKISNLYEDYDIRCELSKSKRFNNNTFGTLLNYDRLMKVKGLIRDEISNND